MELIASNIGKSFLVARRPHYVLRDFSLSLKSGECLGLIGPNGCGKTTLFHVIMGFLKPECGSVSIKEYSCENHSEKKEDKEEDKEKNKNKNVSAYCTLLPEHPRLHKYSSGRQLLTEHGILCGLSSVQIKEKLEEVDHLFDMHTFWDRQSLHYSRGQAGLVSLARVHMDKKTFLLLDEPTNGLDFEMTNKVHSWIKLCQENGHGVLLASHSLNEIAFMTSRKMGIRDGNPISQEEVEDWMRRFSPSSSE